MIKIVKNVVTLYIDDSSLRLMVAQGDTIKKWAEAPLDPGIVKGNVVVDEAALADAVRQLFKSEKVGMKKVIVGMSGLHCLTRPMVLPALPKAMLDEAVMREAKRVLPVPLEQLYVAWQPIPGAPEGKTQVFIVAVPCKVADPLFKALRRAGIKASMLDVKPLSLIRLVKEPLAVVVDVQPAEFDIIIMANGVPQPIRTVPLPSDALSQKDKWARLNEELDRTIKFYNTNNPEKVLGPDAPMYVSGELANRPRLDKSLAEGFGFDVQTLTSPRCTEELDPARCVVNIGLLLKDPSCAGEIGASVVNINALPTPYRPKPVPLLKAVAIPAGVAFIGVSILLTTYIQDASAKVTATQSQLENTNILIAQRTAKKKELTTAIADLEKKFASTQAMQTTFEKAITALGKYHEKYEGDLLTTTDNLPQFTQLATLSQTSDRLSVTGVATDEVEVLNYGRSLEGSGRFSEVTVSSLKRAGTNMDFTLTLNAVKKEVKK